MRRMPGIRISNDTVWPRLSQRALGLVLAWWMLILLMSIAAAQTPPAESGRGYPSRPVRVIVGYPPGGPTDLTARLAGQHLSETLGQQFVMDNRPGAGATLGATLLSRAEPDGYTLMLAANGEMAISPNLRRTLPYDPIKDFAPISRIGASQLVLVVHPGVSAKSVADLLALAKAKPGSVNFASAGSGSTAHLAGELFKQLAAIDIVHVPYKGAGPAMTDLMGLAPARTPRVVVEQLHRELAAMARRPDMIERFRALGIEPEGNSPQEFSRQIRDEIAKWGRIVKLANVPLE